MPTQPESWQSRQAAIRELLARGTVRSQTELIARLARRGFRVTQPSVSRDLREMHVAKADGRYVLPEALLDGSGAPAEAPAVLKSIRSVRPAGPHLLVVRTPPGAASAVGLAIDDAGWPEVAGTVAGDDTLFVATEGRARQARLAARLRALVGKERS